MTTFNFHLVFVLVLRVSSTEKQQLIRVSSFVLKILDPGDPLPKEVQI